MLLMLMLMLQVLERLVGAMPGEGVEVPWLLNRPRDRLLTKQAQP